MKAVNLIPGDARRVNVATSTQSGGLVYGVLAVLFVAVLLVTADVLSADTVSQRKAKLAAISQQDVQASATSARLAPYTAFAQLAQTRAETVREITSARFDWHAALTELSQVVPANTSLQSLNATVAPGGSSTSLGTGTNLRGDIDAPAFEIAGCTGTQDDVARLLSRLRLINGVSRVSLESSQKSDSGQTGTGLGSAAASPGGCPANSPAFDLVVWFGALPGAGATGVSSADTAATVPTSGAATP